MVLLGALAAGVFAFFAVGMLTGNAPEIKLRSDKAKAEVSNRQIWLTQAGLELTPAQYHLGLAIVAFITFGVVSAITATPIVALAPAIAAVALPHTFFSRRRARNLNKNQQAWPDAIREIIASIESNASLHGALVALAYKGPEPLRQAFERFPTMASTIGVVAALESVRERLADPTSDRVIEVLILAHERGGGIVTDILRDLAHATTEDLQLDEEIESAALEQKINSRAVFIIPWLVLILLVMSNEGFRNFYQSSGGILVVVGGAGLSGLGMFLISRLGQDVKDPRVFGGSALAAKRAPATADSGVQDA
jgi:tight adherence protein B